MTGRSDDFLDTLEENGMDDALAAFLDELRGFASGPVPEPNAELAALLYGVARLRRRHRRPSWNSVVAAAAAVVIVVGGAASQRELPEPAQTVVSDVVGGLAPFHLSGLSPRLFPPTPSASAGAEREAPVRASAPAHTTKPKAKHLAEPTQVASPPPLSAGAPVAEHRNWPGSRHQVGEHHWPGRHMGDRNWTRRGSGGHHSRWPGHHSRWSDRRSGGHHHGGGHGWVTTPVATPMATITGR
jgi:hypothetical protein